MNIGKKILSAFVEVSDTPPDTKPLQSLAGPVAPAPADNHKFGQHFESLFAELSPSGPGYREFSKMVTAMSGIADEQARFTAAFAGLSVQGLDRAQLLQAATRQLEALDADAARFRASVEAARQEKVQGRAREIETREARMAQLTAEIQSLHHEVEELRAEMGVQEEKIGRSQQGYEAASLRIRQSIEADLEKIRRYIG